MNFLYFLLVPISFGFDIISKTCDILLNLSQISKCSCLATLPLLNRPRVILVPTYIPFGANCPSFFAVLSMLINIIGVPVYVHGWISFDPICLLFLGINTWHSIRIVRSIFQGLMWFIVLQRVVLIKCSKPMSRNCTLVLVNVCLQLNIAVWFWLWVQAIGFSYFQFCRVSELFSGVCESLSLVIGNNQFVWLHFRKLRLVLVIVLVFILLNVYLYVWNVGHVISATTRRLSTLGIFRSLSTTNSRGSLCPQRLFALRSSLLNRGRIDPFPKSSILSRVLIDHHGLYLVILVQFNTWSFLNCFHFIF